MPENPTQRVIKELPNYKSSLGFLPIAFKALFPHYFILNKNMDRWNASKKVAKKLETNPLEILVLDTPTAMLPEKRKELIENPSFLFGNKYHDFLIFANEVTKNNGKVLQVDPKIFTPGILADLDVSGNSDNSYRDIIEEKANSDLRNKLPYLNGKRGFFDPNLPVNKHYEAIARQTKNGILAAFKELADHSFSDNQDKQYKERVALLAGLAALEVLFIPKDNHRFKPLLISGR